MRPYALFPYHQHGNFATLLLAGVQIVDYVLDLPHLAVTFVQIQFCRQLVSLAHGVAAGVLQVILAKRLGFPGDFTHVVCRAIPYLKRAAQQFGLPSLGWSLT